MSEQGWRDFVNADGLDDWVVLHGGAAAVFMVSSLGEAARLAAAISAVPGVAGAGVLITMGDDRVTVRLTRGLEFLDARHPPLARMVSDAARAVGAVADRGAVQEVQVAVAAVPGDIDVGFWRAVLGYAELAPDNAVDRLGHSSTVWMQELSPEKTLRHAMHLDVSVAREHALARVTAAVAAGGRIVDDSGAPEGWILADRAGNRVCVAAWPDGSATAGADETQMLVATVVSAPRQG